MAIIKLKGTTQIREQLFSVTTGHNFHLKIPIFWHSFFFQRLVKREMETKEKSSHLVNRENDLSSYIKIEIDIAEERWVDIGELVGY